MIEILKVYVLILILEHIITILLLDMVVIVVKRIPSRSNRWSVLAHNEE